MNDIHPLLEWLNRGYYKFLDLDYEYNGLVIHHPQGGIPYKMGTWTDGKLSYEGGFKDFKDWKESDYNFSKPYSEDTAQKIDKEISKLIEGQYERAIKLVKDNEDKLTTLAERLLEKEVLFKDDLLNILGERPFDKKDTEVEIEKEKKDESATE